MGYMSVKLDKNAKLGSEKGSEEEKNEEFGQKLQGYRNSRKPGGRHFTEFQSSKTKGRSAGRTR